MYSARVYFRSHKRSTQLENSGGCFPYHQVRFSLESRIAQEQDNQDGLTNAGLIKIPLNNFPCTNLIIFEKKQYPCYQKSKHNTNELLAQIAKGTQVPLRYRLGVTFFVAHLAVTLILWCAPNKVSAT